MSSEQPVLATDNQQKTKPNWVYILFPIILWSFVFLVPSGVSPEGLGKLTGSMLWPLLIGYFTRGRKGDWAGFSRFFFWIGTFLPAFIQSLKPH